MNDIVISPSILAADFAHLGAELQSVHSAEWIHVDVMDGRFVPNITIGPMIVEAVKRSTDRVVDVHLMIADPDRYLEEFVTAGADVLTVHVEACTHLDRTLAQIRDLGAKAAVALNPATPVSTIEHVLHRLDMVLAMTVNPGFGGQSYLPSVEPKLMQLREMIGDAEILIEVDGGISAANAGRVVAAGADVLVAGSAIFGQSDRSPAIDELRRATRR
jgi:ribulose-phosphate 3-epimerase